MEISLILLAAGSGSRLEIAQKKQWLRSGSKPFWLIALENLLKSYDFRQVIVVGEPKMRDFIDEISFDGFDDFEKRAEFFRKFSFVDGGNTRQESLANALAVAISPFVMTSDAARINVNNKLVLRLIDAIKNGDFKAAVPVLECADSVILGKNYINRDELKLIGTPQLSSTDLLKNAIESAIKNNEFFTDDSSALAKMGAKIAYVKGDKTAFKLTNKDDLKALLKSGLNPPENSYFNGHGFDVHRFCDGDFVTLCGAKIPHNQGILAHSDGDAPLHALCDALFGAAGLGDIGEFFPDNDPAFKGANSLKLLERSAKIVRSYGFEIVNADITILCERPKITPHKEKMKENVAKALKIGRNFVNIKATTMEKMGFIGEQIGLGAIANATIKYFDWTKV